MLTLLYGVHIHPTGSLAQAAWQSSPHMVVGDIKQEHPRVAPKHVWKSASELIVPKICPA